MRELHVSHDAINAIRELLQQFQDHCEAHPDPAKQIVEKKAIDHILEEEQDWCRTKPNNPGFDLYRINSETEKEEWCEVKSLSSKFDQVSMSITQFQEARECGEAYWLYIVENVSEIDEGGKPNILRIQNPAGRTESITYRRHVWQDFVEPK